MAAMVEAQDIIHRPDILLNHGISSAIDSVDYIVKTFGAKSLITILTDKELELEETGFNVGNAELEYFFCIYLLSFLIKGDYNNAKYLWKRSPKSFHKHSSLANVWSVGKHLFNNNISAAFSSLRNSSYWTNELHLFINILIESLTASQIELIADSYSSMRITSISSLFALSRDDTIALISHYGWQIENNEYIIPNNNTISNKLSNTLDDEVDVLSRLSTYISYLEKKPLKVEVSGNSNDKNDNNKNIQKKN